MIEDFDNSIIDRTEGDLPEKDINILKETPEYADKELPGVEPTETDPTKGIPETDFISPSDIEE